MSAPVNLFFDMGEGPAKFTLLSMQSPYWFAAKCRRHECPLEASPFECPFSKPCGEVKAGDWESICIQDSEEEDDGQNS